MDEEKTIGKKTYSISSEIEEISKKIMKEENLNFDPAKIGYMLVSPDIMKTKIAQCVRSKPELKYFSDYDYIVEVSQKIWDQLTNDLKYIVIYHELLHVLPLMNQKTGNYNFNLADHDLQDFRRIISKFGIDWIEKISIILNSLYQMEKQIEGEKISNVEL